MRIIAPSGSPHPRSRPLTGGEILVVVIIMILATGLALADLPVFGIIELFGGTAAVILRLRRPGDGGSSAPVR
ncbi:hypothetical protein AMK16_25880 [Streptomyces sp. CB00455]|uniref:hypothetical protein n=1 Tax=Streptomyces sp. CB00455 TaxID=1703927 RepID=UPI000940320C|nr:hypothetical protein [Streptomyces sp. CB00455]OKK16137.1 hypothetical protein AMK16_25880 [Streptomyces sp. CB00455]